MSLRGATNDEKIWNYLIDAGLNEFGAAGVEGNIYAESGCIPTNLQNSYEKKLGMTDAQYTAAVDNGSYKNFINDKAGYGLVQWTFWSLKEYLYNFAKKKGKSIGDLEMQLECLCTQLKEQYPAIWKNLSKATSVLQASNEMLLKFERPADQSETVQKKRAGYGQSFYDKYAKKNGGTTMGYTNSSLVDCTVKSPNHSGQRTHKIDRITPHCVVGQLSAEGIGGCFPKGREASCNYGIGKDGRVCLIVDEANRSWCSSSGANDQRAITIECASDSTAPYAFNDAVYKKLVALCIDICKRNGLKKVLWFADKDKSLNYEPKDGECVLTVHRWFANKSCPGDWMYARMCQLANEINAGLGNNTPVTHVVPDKPEENKNFPAVPFTVQVLISDLNYRSRPSMEGTIKGQTGKGSFTIVEVDNGWGKLKSGAGWIYLENPEYVKIGSSVSGGTTPQPSGLPYIVRVTDSALNIRQGAGTNYPVVGCIRDKGSYTIVAESAGKGSDKGWGKLKSGAGWISLDYCKRV